MSDLKVAAAILAGAVAIWLVLGITARAMDANMAYYDNEKEVTPCLSFPRVLP